MSEQLIFYVGNRNPSISQTITSGGTAIDLSSDTVTFYAREVGGTALLVDGGTTTWLTDGSDGGVRYDWTSTDASSGILSQERYALVWWRDDDGTRLQDVGEALIEVRAHASLSSYVELEELKSTLELTATSFADMDIQRALVSASRGVDAACNRRFYQDEDANQVRYYSPNRRMQIDIHDLCEFTALDTDLIGGTAFDSSWTLNQDFTFDPLNADLDSKPWERLRVHPLATQVLPAYPRSVRLTGRFGWPTVPEAIKEATGIVATRLLKRAREAPFGVVTVGLEGEAVRISRFDSDVQDLLSGYVKSQVLAGG
jgi:hypothetical protein